MYGKDCLILTPLTAGVQLQQPGIQPEVVSGVGEKLRQSLSFLGLPVYFKFKILFYTFTKTLGQRFDIFSSPSPKFIISINHCCSSNRVPASGILSESPPLSIIYFLLCVLYLTCDYIVTHATFLSLFIFLNPVCP